MKRVKTRLCELLNIDLPILQAPMGGAVSPEFASTVANNGALGMLPIGTYSLEKCEQLIDATLALTDNSIGINLILEWDQSERLALSLNKGIKIVWFFWGDPSPYIEKAHQHNAKVIVTVADADQAKRAVDAGADVIVAQGWEAGGHVYGQVATFPLIPTIVDAVAGKVPVVAAGGVADGRGLVAALALGADGVVLGTRLLSSVESCAHQQYKERLVNANETDTVYTELFDKEWRDAPMRVLRNSTYDAWVKAGKPPLGKRPGENDVIAKYAPQQLVERYSYCIPSTIMEGDLEAMAHYAGQSVALVKDIQPLDVIFKEVIDEAVECIHTIQMFTEN